MNEQDYPPLPAGVRVGSATYLLMKMWVNADRAQQSARHREELLAYEVTVGNLREQAQPSQQFPFVPWSKEAEMVESWTAQPERKPMTEECIKELYGDSNFDIVGPSVIAFVRAVEAFHGIKEQS